MEVRFSKDIYPKVSLLKAAYAFVDVAYIHIDLNEKEYIVTIECKSKQNLVSEKDFLNEILCQTVRHQIYLETKSIREMITARTVASTVIEMKNDSNMLPGDSTIAENDIVKDWFE